MYLTDSTFILLAMSLIVSLKLAIFSVNSLLESFHSINPPRLDIALYIQYEIHGVCVQKNRTDDSSNRVRNRADIRAVIKICGACGRLSGAAGLL